MSAARGLLALTLATAVCGAQTSTSELAPDFAVSARFVLDVDGDGADELVLVGRDGRVRTFGTTGDAFSAAVGDAAIPDPARALVTATTLDRGGAPRLVVAGPRGVAAWPFGARGAFGGTPTPLIPEYRLDCRTGRPLAAPIARDFDGDGREDFALPAGDLVEVWRRREGADGATPAFVRTATARADDELTLATKGALLSDVLALGLRIRRLTLADVNGDGRPDFLGREGRRRTWRLQRPDGAVPEAPDVTVDLETFQDTTPPAPLKPGRTLAGGDNPRLDSRDLNGDGIPDYVVAHRRKVWVFLGTRAGPQFKEPSAILKTADDVTALLLAQLDDDGLPDLLVIRVQVPTVTSLIFGMLGDWDVDVAALGYRNEGGRTFSNAPTWKRELTLTLPSIAGIVRNPEALLQRFENLGRKSRTEVFGDFDGDGRGDLAMTSEDERAVEVWRGVEKPASRRAASGVADALPDDDEADRSLRRLFFEDPSVSWTVDTLLAWLEGRAGSRAARLTGGRAPDLRIAPPIPAGFEFEDLAGFRAAPPRTSLLASFAAPSLPGHRRYALLRP